jgi:hypothetical protein
MTVVSIRQDAPCADNLGEIRDEHRDIQEDVRLRQALVPDDVSARTGLSYAEIIHRHGIFKFVFSYSTSAFHALDADGETLASGETIRELLDSL